MKEDAETTAAGVSAVDGAVFALLGLLIAFTFSGASTRFDTRRQLIVEATNHIGTAYLRLDFLPAKAQHALRENFRRYVDARIEVNRKLPDMVAAKNRWPRRSSCKNKSGGRRWPPAGRKGLRLRRRCCCCLR